MREPGTGNAAYNKENPRWAEGNCAAYELIESAELEILQALASQKRRALLAARKILQEKALAIVAQFWTASVLTCTGRNKPARIICAIHRRDAAEKLNLPERLRFRLGGEPVAAVIQIKIQTMLDLGCDGD